MAYRRISPPQLQSLLRDLDRQRRQAIDQANQEIRRRNDAVRRAVDDYNSKVAVFALKPRNPGAARHFCSSARDLRRDLACDGADHVAEMLERVLPQTERYRIGVPTQCPSKVFIEPLRQRTHTLCTQAVLVANQVAL
jgi:hypothetical protein